MHRPRRVVRCIVQLACVLLWVIYFTNASRGAAKIGLLYRFPCSVLMGCFILFIKMTCIKINNSTIVCTGKIGRIKVEGRYINIDFHPYCGPNFYKDRNMQKLYEPTGSDDPVWPEFYKWLEKHKQSEQKKKLPKFATS